MDTIDKWLKSLRLHKYTHLFTTLTYDQMLNLNEEYLIKMDVTKGARNKMLVSVKKLNLRQERLINMMDDLNQDNISMKEALTVFKDMLITPIPPSTQKSELTNLFIETLEKVAHRLIESAGMEDNACHGIMAAIVDECLKHNSFTKEQKAKVASFNQHFTKEQKAKAASFKQHFTKEQKAKIASFKQQLRQRPHSYNHHHYHQNQFHQNHNHHYHYHHHHNHWNGPIQPPSLSASLSTIGSASTSDEEEQQTYREYSLLGPGMTFELPCLRALAATEKHNRLCFLRI